MQGVPSDSIHVAEESSNEATVVSVTLDRPERLNALTPDLVVRLIEVFDSIRASDADCIILEATGADFCTGADTAALSPDEEEGFEIGLMQQMVETLRRCPVPIISRVQGRAFGAGFMLAMASDIVVAAGQAQFGLQEVNLGLPVEGYTTTLLSRIIGERRAREWVLTGMRVSSERAYEAGFVSCTPNEDELDEKVSDYVSEFASGSSRTISELKQRMADPTSPKNHDEVREVEREALSRAYQSEDLRGRLSELSDS